LKIYTRTGDRGETGLFGGRRISKDDLRVEAYGSIDELNSTIGAVRSLKPPPDLDRILETIQRDLFVLGADLATPAHAEGAEKIPRIGEEHVARLERQIDSIQGKLPQLTSFILPGGSPVGSQLHLARAICRRAERRVVSLSKAAVIGEAIIPFLNRLSDLLFVLARWANKASGSPEVEWKG